MSVAYNFFYQDIFKSSTISSGIGNTMCITAVCFHFQCTSTFFLDDRINFACKKMWTLRKILHRKFRCGA
jgi:hypothetical protein